MMHALNSDDIVGKQKQLYKQKTFVYLFFR